MHAGLELKHADASCSLLSQSENHTIGLGVNFTLIIGEPL